MISYQIKGNIAKVLEEKNGKALLAMANQLKISSRDIVESAQDKHKYISRTGNLDNSIQWESKGQFQTVIGLDTNKAPYADFQHEGTKAHSIKPRDKKALRFVGNSGRFFFSKGHKVSGIKRDQFIYNSFRRLKSKVDLDFKNVLEKVF